MTRSDDAFVHALEAQVEAELTLAESSTPESDVPVGEWEFDPIDVQREEVGLRNLLGAARALGPVVRDDPAGQS
jgi:hypothetical protein